MVGSVNKVILLGNLGRDPEIRAMQSGNKMATFSLATSKRWKDKATQEQKDKTSWHNVVIFGEGLVGIVEKYVKKGSKVYIEGELNTRKWQDQSGQDRYTTEVIVSGFNGTLQMLDRRDGVNSEAPTQSTRPPESSQSAPKITPVAQDEFEDDIPF